MISTSTKIKMRRNDMGKVTTFFLVILWLVILCIPVMAQEDEDAELEALIKSAEAAASEEELASAELSKSQSAENDRLMIKVFRGGERALQKLNPEISVVADMAASFIHQDGHEYSDYMRSGFNFRVLGIHFQSNLDPFSFMKATVGATPGKVELGEAYLTWNRIPHLQITFGKFRQQLGIVNRWHKPGLDQWDFPLVLSEHLGPGGLNQIGASFVWLMPSLWAHQQEVEVQVTNGMNPKFFSGDYYGIPSFLVHLRNYYDLSRNTYIELGLTGMHGYNHKNGEKDKDGNYIDESSRRSEIGGLDLSLIWEPVDRAKYRSLEWRSEFLYFYKECFDDEAMESYKLESYGGYSYLQYKFARNWIVGGRLDLTLPFERHSSSHRNHIWQISPYFTWWQSPWVRLRLEFNYNDSSMRPEEYRILFQVTGAAGPHKHERY